ncbi:hypothetical protein HaLaN_32952, partial [Haematococcus lacustris]
MSSTFQVPGEQAGQLEEEAASSSGGPASSWWCSLATQALAPGGQLTTEDNPGQQSKVACLHFKPIFSFQSTEPATPAFAATHTRAGMFLAMRQACKRAR